ncbi:OLC1v1008321C1 [Oldenlandia corymbosa var. corymbosa]|uniref:OLC1v1008321C1 n=1 Tax=Oldenlandia corymbosa var. corymbosa TaxID=529605 RepID=A0AAV1DLC0_OLDCO|nr:OLC1v1008321C1 [Oldenlandia corymbosa var. corymbosa]
MVGCWRLSSSNMAKFVVVVLMMLLFVAPNIGIVSSEEASFNQRRHLMQVGNGSESGRVSDNTARVDPLDHLKKYRGGYDITNKHYWSSTAFTGIYGYTIAVAWALCGLVYGLCLVVTSCCYKKKKVQEFKNGSNIHKQFYLRPVLVAVFLTLLAIIGCGLVLGGTAKFHSRAKTVVDILINTADDASDTIYNTTTAMDDMNNSLEAAQETGRVSGFLSSTSKRLDDQAADISRQARKNRRAIYKGLKIVYIITSVIISINLVAAIVMTVSGILKSRRSLRLLIGICWIVAFFCWMFFGIYYFIYNFADDTCTALEGFQQDPYNNSLSSLLPCDELLSAKSVLSEVSAEVHNIVNQVNRNIDKTYGNIAQICNPFSPPPEYQYQPQKCPADTIQIGDIPQLLKLVACPDYEGSTCTGGILIPVRDYNLMESYSTSIQRLLNQYPHLERLVECQTVTDAFSDILHNHCKPLKRYGRMVWGALAFLSVVMVALVLICVYEVVYQLKHRSSDSSVKPYSTGGETLESGVDKATNNDYE